MKDILIYRPRFYYVLFFPFLIVSIILLIFTDKSNFFLLTNSFHAPVADQFFFWITWLGNGLVFAMVCLFVLIRNIGQGLLGFGCFVLSALLPQLLKKLIFFDALRPTKYLQDQSTLHLVEGVKQYSYHSFPSGHSTSIFALSLFLTFIVKDKRWGLLFCGLAILTAYSRVYLAQHFWEDIFAGAILGFISTLTIFLSMEKWAQSKLNKGLLK